MGTPLQVGLIGGKRSHLQAFSFATHTHTHAHGVYLHMNTELGGKKLAAPEGADAAYNVADFPRILAF